MKVETARIKTIREGDCLFELDKEFGGRIGYTTWERVDGKGLGGEEARQAEDATPVGGEHGQVGRHELTEGVRLIEFSHIRARPSISTP